MTHLPDEDLLLQAAQKNEAAFTELYSRYTGNALNTVSRHLRRHPSEVEDVIAKTWAEIWNSASNFDPNKGTAKAWLTTVFSRRAMDAARRLDRSIEDTVLEDLNFDAAQLDTLADYRRPNANTAKDRTRACQIPCPHCKSRYSRVVDSRWSEKFHAVRRRRVCSCGKRFTTHESVEMQKMKRGRAETQRTVAKLTKLLTRTQERFAQIQDPLNVAT